MSYIPPHSSTTSSQPQQKPHPRQALRNRNLPPLPDFEFPRRSTSPCIPRIEEQPPTPVLPTFAPENEKDREIRERSGSRPRSRAISNREEGRLRSESLIQGVRGRTNREIESEKRENSGERKEKERQENQDRRKVGNEKQVDMAIKDLSKKGQWIFYAITSGACAAANGVFAKLTTTELTTSIASFLAHLFGLTHSTFFETLVRGFFFVCNLVFNGIMWALFTKALSRSPSTTQVAILNTSSNFMITALLGWMIFSESLPGLWWIGACFLVAGNVIIGQREEKEVPVPGEETAGERNAESGESGYREEGTALLADAIELEDETEEQLREARANRMQEDEDLLDLPAAGSGGVRL